ncbi:hypothetical protein PHYPSEUDO_002095 [Phytophthora pseudosyringae]|uniref:M96 mating-specific protein family n=1 Tax=Phytophthora pseudosyringae TaxID=221518 RepID=A0A8T1VY83_9STRA|nr:hypothetical protein PHYPSEUDO_002095 [Phytophthora pseudosyringae]
MADAMLLDDFVGFLRHIDDPELIQSLDASRQGGDAALQLDAAALDGLFSASDHHSDSDCTSRSVASSCSPRNAEDVVDVRSRDAIRRKTYREKQKAQRDALHEQVGELSTHLTALTKSKEAAKARAGLGLAQTAVWKALANRNLQARLNAEEQRCRLQAALEKRSTLIRELGVLIRKRISGEPLEDVAYAAKRPRTETPDRALYEAYINELDESYTSADSVLKAAAVYTDLTSCEDTRLYYNPPRSSSKDADYHELVGSFSTPFAYERVREHLHEVCCMELHPGFELVDEPWVPEDTTITKWRVGGPGSNSLVQHCVMRQFNEGDRTVLVWRKFSEGAGVFAGMHSDETGWSVVRPSPSCENGSVSAVLELVSRFVPISFSTAAASSAVVKQFAGILIKDGEETCQLAIQKLEEMLLDEALGVC